MANNMVKSIFLGASFCVVTATAGFAQGLAGPYLAATRANFNSDFEDAARYYTAAMAVDTQNTYLKQNALVSFIAAGDFDVAVSIAQALHASDGDNIFANLVIMVDLIDKGDLVAAQDVLPQDRARLSPLLQHLIHGWVKVGSGQLEAGLAEFDGMSENDTIALYGQYHKALALADNGNFADAADILDGDDGPLHINRDSIFLHVAVLGELDRKDAALNVLDTAALRGFKDAKLTTLRDDIAAGKPQKYTDIDAPAQGISEAFLTIAVALSRDEPSRLALFYARLAQHLNANSVDAALTVANILEREEQFSLAIEAYKFVPRTSLSYNSAQIGRAEAERRTGQIDVATNTLLALADVFPQDVNTLNALGDIYRGVDNFTDAVAAYTRAVDAIEQPLSGHWVLFYTRGISYERLDNWPAAEADLKHALELSPNQPLVLNYLGYSYIEMGINMAEAQAMIETAVAGKPNSGYITDSLAWVLYRLGKFEEAVPHMERAAELLPVDPVINDHLGDILWMVGRKLEAKFQWRRAMSFDPEKKDVIRIKRKLELGLDMVLTEESNL